MMIMVIKLQYCRYSEQLVKQNFSTLERDYREMQLAGEGRVVIDHPGLVKGDETVCLSRIRAQWHGILVAILYETMEALNWTILWAPPPILRR